MALRDKVDAVVFDLFGTLVHFVTRPQFSEWLADRLEVDPIEVASAMSGVFYEFEVGMDAQDRMATVLELLEVKGKYNISYLVEAERADLQGRTALYPGVPTTLAWLCSQGLKVGLCSNANPYGIEIARSHELLNWIPAPAFSCDVGSRKPDKQIYLRAAEQIGVPPERCLYVDDGGDRSLWGAKKVGMTTVRVKHIDHEQDDYLLAHYEVEAVADVADLIKTAD